MLNKITQEQLRAVKVADLSAYSAETNTCIIPKADIAGKMEKIKPGVTLLVKLDPSLLIKNTADPIQTNWNGGKIPQYLYYQIDIKNIIGKNIQCVGIAYDFNKKETIPSFWSGFLPIDRISLVEEE